MKVNQEVKLATTRMEMQTIMQKPEVYHRPAGFIDVLL